jgi:hypothetical protein
MNILDKIALQNLDVILHPDNPVQNNNILIKHNRLIYMNDHNDNDSEIDHIYSVNDMEYVVYFTFNRIIGLLRSLQKIYETEDLTYTDLLSNLTGAYYTIEEYSDNLEEDCVIFQTILSEIDEQIDLFYEKKCILTLERFSNYIYNILYSSAKIVFDTRIITGNCEETQSEEKQTDIKDTQVSFLSVLGETMSAYTQTIYPGYSKSEESDPGDNISEESESDDSYENPSDEDNLKEKSE